MRKGKLKPLEWPKLPPTKIDLSGGPVEVAHHRPIVQSVKGGGSGTGLSYYEAWLDCPEAAWLTENYGKPSNEDLDTGTILHSFMELYYTYGKQPFSAQAVEFTDDAGNPYEFHEGARIKAEEMFRGYRVNYPVEEIGKVIAVEKLLPEEGNTAQAKAICDAVGVDPYTLKLDLVTHANRATVERWKTTRKIDAAPGYWAVDWKSDGGFGSYMDKMYLRTQFTAYQLAWNAAFPKMKLNGLLCVLAHKRTKVPAFTTIVIQAPTAADVAVLHSTIANAVDVMTNRPRMKNQARCMDHGRLCHWYTSGMCRRY